MFDPVMTQRSETTLHHRRLHPGLRQQGRRAAVDAAGGVYEKMVASALTRAQELMLPDLPRTAENAVLVQQALLLGLSGTQFPPQRAGGLVTLAMPGAPPGCLVPDCANPSCVGNRVTVAPGTGKLGLHYTHLKNTVASGTSRLIRGEILSRLPSLSVRH